MKHLIRLLCFIMALGASSSFAASHPAGDRDITAKTKISGVINGSPIKVNVTSKFNTGRGGLSSCEFSQLPTGFNPATLGTHA